MRLSCNDTDRNTDRSSQLLNMCSEVINKKPRGKLKTYFVLKYFIKYEYKGVYIKYARGGWRIL